MCRETGEILPIMKVSILGTNGFLSNAIAAYCNRKGWHLYMYGRTLPQLKIKYDSYYEIDLITSDLDCSLLADSDIIVYAVGAGIQSNIDDNSKSIYSLNVAVPISICNDLKKINYSGTIVTFGSYFELGIRSIKEPATEQEVLETLNPTTSDYILSKRLLTRFVSCYTHRFNHWHFVLPTIYGAGENSNRLIPYTIKSIKNGRTPSYTSGIQIRQYLNVKNVPQVIDSAYCAHLTSGIYNIAGNEILTIKDIVGIIYKTMGKDVDERSFGICIKNDTEMPYLALNGQKLDNLINHSTIGSIVNSINEYLCY